MSYELLNPSTGELVLRDAEGHETHLLYTEQAVDAIEDQFGEAIMPILRRLWTRDLRGEELRRLVWHGMVGWHQRHPTNKKPPTFERAGKLVARVGLAECFEAAAIALAASDYLGMATPLDDDTETTDDDDVDEEGEPPDPPKPAG